MGGDRAHVGAGRAQAPVELEGEDQVGPAVNEVARIEALCRSLEQQVIVSAAFADAAGEAGARLVSLGRFALKGVRRPEELFTVDPGG